MTETESITILWDYSIQTYRRIKTNKSDITIKDREEKACRLINVKVPADKNVSVAEFEKLTKCKDLETEVEKLKL